MGERLVEADADGVGGGAHGVMASHALRDRLVYPGSSFARTGIGERKRGPPGSRGRDRRQELLHSAAGPSAHRDHRDPQSATECLLVEGESATGGEVGHVEGDDRRQATSNRRDRQRETTGRIGRVDHDHRGVRGLVEASVEAVPAHLALGDVEIHAVDAGEIHDVDRNGASSAASEPDLRGRTGIVRGTGPQTAETVEQRGLAGVGIAEQCDSARGRGLRVGGRVRGRWGW